MKGFHREEFLTEGKHMEHWWWRPLRQAYILPGDSFSRGRNTWDTGVGVRSAATAGGCCVRWHKFHEHGFILERKKYLWHPWYAAAARSGRFDRKSRNLYTPPVFNPWPHRTFSSMFLLSERRPTPLEHCSVHNMSLFISSSGLKREAKVHRAKVCVNCTEPSVARSSYWSRTVGQYLSDSHCKGLVVILARWTASNMAEEPQRSTIPQVKKWWTTSGSSDFRMWHVASIRYPHDLA